ncbi:hypothetical protein AVEN_76657-1 [Araneus ventricosus]|uniref:Uncharacterized protein n=1 Tax=Araneus ventricosus TaxID=182803 RepID=A0A4Y2BQK1_ARAVE|nr:hypothetical protein AVEN_76657-1 [Araneus ventricosus]
MQARERSDRRQSNLNQCTPLGAFLVLANFLGALNRHPGSTPFLAIVDARYIFDKLKRQKHESASLVENAWCVSHRRSPSLRCAYNVSQMLSLGFS